MQHNQKAPTLTILNRKARFNYEIITSYEAGLVLQGTEVKSIRAGTANIQDSYAYFKQGELYLINAHISPYRFAQHFQHEPTQSRKLLLKKKELHVLKQKIKEKGFTLVPIQLYSKNGKIKVNLAVCRGKKLYDKRRTLKERELKKQIRESKYSF